jgi:hypothetical protein
LAADAAPDACDVPPDACDVPDWALPLTLDKACWKLLPDCAALGCTALLVAEAGVDCMTEVYCKADDRILPMLMRQFLPNLVGENWPEHLAFMLTSRRLSHL